MSQDQNHKSKESKNPSKSYKREDSITTLGELYNLRKMLEEKRNKLKNTSNDNSKFKSTGI